MPPVLSELEQSLDSALQRCAPGCAHRPAQTADAAPSRRAVCSVTLLPAIYAGVCTARTQHAASTPLPSGRAPPAG